MNKQTAVQKPSFLQSCWNGVKGFGRSLVNGAKAVKTLVVAGSIMAVTVVSSLAQTDPEEIVTSASGKYNTAVAVFISAAVIGAAIMFIRKGLRGRM